MTTTSVVTKVCLGCEQRLKDASEAMRRHGAEMNSAIYVARSGGGLTEEERQDFRAKLLASLDKAQAAWDAYRAHLIEHGIL